MAATGLVFAASPAFSQQIADRKKKSCPNRRALERVAAEDVSAKKPPIVIGKRDDDIESFDPHESVSSSAAEIIGNLYETLVVWNPATGAIDPDKGLASSFTRSDDGRTWTFKLKPARKFASGNPITADDVVFSFERLFAISGAAANVLGPLGFVVGEASSPFAAVKDADNDKVTITLPPGAPDRLLFPCLTASVCSVIDKRLLEANYARDLGTISGMVGATAAGHDSGRIWLKLNSAGSGPFRIAEIDACNAPESPDAAKKGGPVPLNDEIVLRANEHYPGNSAQTRSIVVRGIADPVEQRRQLDRQDVQVAWNLGFPRDADDKPLTTVTMPAGNLLLLCMNAHNENGHLGLAQVRQAIRCAINVQRLANELNSKRWSPQHEFCPSVLCKDSLGVNSLGTNSPFNPDTARALLGQAGIKTRIELTIDHIAGNPRSHVATLLANQLDEVGDQLGGAGFRIKLQPSSARAFLNRLERRDYQLALLSWNADYPDPHSNAYTFCANSETDDHLNRDRTMAWYCRWFESDLDAVAKAAGQETDKAKRLEKYKDLQGQLHEKGPFAFLLEETRIVATRRNGPVVVVGMLDNFTRYPTQNN